MAPDAILDAARATFEQFGARRANVDDVATAAGISRSTLYRRFPNKDALLAAVVMREVDSFFDALITVAEGLPLDEIVVECFAKGMRSFQEIPLLGRLMQTEPEVLNTMAGSQHVLIANADRVATTLRAGGATMPDHDLRIASEMMLRIAASCLSSPQSHAALETDDDIRAFARRFIAPMVH